jgi:hypothetical protein
MSQTRTFQMELGFILKLSNLYRHLEEGSWNRSENWLTCSREANIFSDAKDRRLSMRRICEGHEKAARFRGFLERFNLNFAIGYSAEVILVTKALATLARAKRSFL